MTPEELRSLRHALNLTQAQLGEQLEVSSRTIVAWESGQTPISRIASMAIAWLVICGQAEEPPGRVPRPS